MWIQNLILPPKSCQNFLLISCYTIKRSCLFSPIASLWREKKEVYFFYNYLKIVKKKKVCIFFITIPSFTQNILLEALGYFSFFGESGDHSTSFSTFLKFWSESGGHFTLSLSLLFFPKKLKKTSTNLLFTIELPYSQLS